MNRRLLITLVIVAAACGGTAAALWPSRGGASARPLLVWGGTGTGPGQFSMPRVVEVSGEHVYVIDKRARIQRFTLGGAHELEWQTPLFDNGKPTGLGFDLEGNLLVADTHYSRVLKYSPDGKLLGSFGSEGTAPGQFIYPTDVACDRDGNLYVTEYGGNDRVQKFATDGKFLLQWGRRGEAPGEFVRPMSVAVGPDGLIYVADACNHRVQVFTPEGALVRLWGEVGGGPGQLRYPYGLAFDGHTIVVCEYGNNRLQRFDLGGHSLGTWGAPGQKPGELSTPWSISVGPKGEVYVADAGNDRIQVARF